MMYLFQGLPEILVHRPVDHPGDGIQKVITIIEPNDSHSIFLCSVLVSTLLLSVSDV